MAKEETEPKPMPFDCAIGEERIVYNPTGHTQRVVLDFREGGEVAFFHPPNACYSYKRRTEQVPLHRVVPVNKVDGW